MGFTLTVKAGKDIGLRKDFSQSELSIGRTSDNDFVLGDAGVSRKHAQITFENGQYYIQDLGSANGVMLNGKAVSKEQLPDTCTIGLGPVVLEFANEDKATLANRRPSKPELLRSARSSAEDEPETSEESEDVGRRRRPRRNNSGENISSDRRAGGRHASGNLARGQNPSRRRMSSDAIPEDDDEGRALSVAERARILRENKGAAGKVKIFMAERSAKTRNTIYASIIVIVVIVLCGAVYFVMNQQGGGGGPVASADLSQKHFSLSDSLGEKVFGYGPDLGVNTQTRYELHFDFEVSETIEAIYYLTFDSQGVESSDEISISLNSVPIGNVSGGLGDYVKTQKLKLPKKHMLKGNVNEILFDQLKNTRSTGEKTWAISSVKLQMVPLPKCDVRNGECTREAHQHFEVAEKLWNTRQLAATNAYNALSNLNTSMLFLEAIEPKPDFTRSVQQMTRDVEKYLDQVCSKTMLQVKRNEEMQNYQAVVNELKNGLLWYPGPDHSCYGRLKDKLSEYE